MDLNIPASWDYEPVQERTLVGIMGKKIDQVLWALRQHGARAPLERGVHSTFEFSTSQMSNVVYNRDGGRAIGVPPVLSKNQRKKQNRAARALASSPGGSTSVKISQRKPSAFLKLPADILAQIVPHMTPRGVVHMTRVNKAIRKVLLHRSAAPMWRACIDNQEMPPCPPEMSEPRYLALLFLQECSSCGQKAANDPEFVLLVRLCQPCGKRLLVDDNYIQLSEIRDMIPRSFIFRTTFPHLRTSGLACLKKQVDDVLTRFEELRLAGNEEALRNWMTTRKNRVQQQVEHAKLAEKYLRDAPRIEQDRLKRNWRKAVESKLSELGWSQNEADMPVRVLNQWKQLVERPTILTDAKWNKLKGQISTFIETEAKNRPIRQSEKQRADREEFLKQWFQGLKDQIFAIPNNLNTLSIAERAAVTVKRLPLPQYQEAVQWAVMQDILVTNVPLEQAKVRAEESRSIIEQMTIERGRRAEEEWANILRQGRIEQGLSADPPRPRLLANAGERDPFEDANKDTSLLLRADSIFSNDARHHPWARYRVHIYDGVFAHVALDDWSSYSYRSNPLDTTGYIFHSQASAIARALLADLGDPDASSPEMNNENSWFRCERCQQIIHASWLSMIVHYIRMASDWEEIQQYMAKSPEQEITYNYTHDFGPSDPRPLIVRLSPQQVTQAESKRRRIACWRWGEQIKEAMGILPDQHETGSEDGSNSDSEADFYPDDLGLDVLECLLCEVDGLELGNHFPTVPSIFDHLRNTHNVSDPEQGLNPEKESSLDRSPYFRLLEPAD